MKVCDICQKKKRDNLFDDGKDTCKACTRDIKKFDNIGGLFEERLIACRVCGEKKSANPSNFRGGKTKKSDFEVKGRVCNSCIEREYKKLDDNLQEPRLRKCNKCGKELPNTLVYFVKNYRELDFLNKTCKNCASNYDNKHRKNIIIDDVIHHVCRECGEIKPREDFFMAATKKLIKRCKTCVERVENEIKNGEYEIKKVQCRTCGEYKDLNFENFKFRPECKGYVSPHCKKCQSELNRAYKMKRRNQKT